ncbi:MAG: YcxB family protein [Acidobacteriota bacterium]
MARRLGISFFIALLVAVLLPLLSYISGFWSIVLTVVTLTLGAALAFLIFVYYARLRAAEGFFDKANEPSVTFNFSDEGVITDSDIGSTNLKWAAFDEILKFSDVWLLLYAKSGYMTLPLNQITPECCQFIEQQVTHHRK